MYDISNYILGNPMQLPYNLARVQYHNTTQYFNYFSLSYTIG